MGGFSHPGGRSAVPVGDDGTNSGRSVDAVTELENEHLATMRVEYGSVEKDGSADLDADWLSGGWVALLGAWLADAESAGLAEPNAMVVGTVDSAGRPVTRTVLCKSVDEAGITFFTNYDSAKGRDLAGTAYASATFPWFGLGRQVHVRGAVTKVPAEATDDYWSKRPRGSQLGAWASHQSHPIASRAALLDQLTEVTERFADHRDVPVPPNWGGYLIAPEVVEFWQGRENRVHNRIRVTGDRIERLQP
jgi:pyridoxamine 5'-phosphate oxidase